jgi:hypothetical protein
MHYCCCRQCTERSDRTLTRQATEVFWNESSSKGYSFAGGPLYSGSCRVPASKKQHSRPRSVKLLLHSCDAGPNVSVAPANACKQKQHSRAHSVKRLLHSHKAGFVSQWLLQNACKKKTTQQSTQCETAAAQQLQSRSRVSVTPAECLQAENNTAERTV